MRTDPLIWPFLGAVALYRYGISPFIAGSCRYHPSCSAYADESLRTHGLFRGGFFAIKRICRCHPWGGSGYDPVPPTQMATFESREGS